MGRHTAPSPGQRSWRGRVLALVAATAVVVTGGWFAVSAFGSDGATSSTGSCSSPTTIRVATTDDALHAVNDVASTVESTSDTCVNYLVTAAPSSTTADAILKGDDLGVDSPIDVWIPDSPVWAETVQAQRTDATPAVTKGPAIATSPVVVAVPASLKSMADQPPSWPDILATGKWLLPDPQTYTAALTTVMTFFQSSEKSMSTMRSFVIGLQEHLVPQSRAFTQASLPAAKASVFPASEQQIASYNQTHANGKLTAVVPSTGASKLEYDWVEVGSHHGIRAHLLDQLEKALTSPDGAKTLNDNGFRTKGVDDVGVAGVPATPDYAVETPTLQQLSDMDAQFLTLSKKMRLLTVIDVSGSMKTRDAKNQMSRIELASQASAGALALMDRTASVGLWTFSTALQGNQDWKQVEPIRPVDQVVSKGVTQRQKLTQDLKRLPSELHGDTGLYDTTLAAYKEVQRTYDPATSNTLVIITDGANDDSTGGLTLDQLKAEIKKIEDPNKVVAIVTIGVGKDADQRALAEIAKLSRDGNTYHTESPEQIGAVFVDAFLDFPGRS